MYICNPPRSTHFFFTWLSRVSFNSTMADREPECMRTQIPGGTLNAVLGKQHKDTYRPSCLGFHQGVNPPTRMLSSLMLSNKHASKATCSLKGCFRLIYCHAWRVECAYFAPLRHPYRYTHVLDIRRTPLCLGFVFMLPTSSPLALVLCTG